MPETTSQKLAKEKGIKPRLQLGIKLDGGGVKPTGAHRVKFISDKEVTGSNPTTKKPRQEIKFLFEEDGNQKTYSCPVYKHVKNVETEEPHYFWTRMAEYNYGDELILEMKKSGMINYIDISPVLQDAEDVIDVDDEIPFDDMPEASKGTAEELENPQGKE